MFCEIEVEVVKRIRNVAQNLLKIQPNDHWFTKQVNSFVSKHKNVITQSDYDKWILKMFFLIHENVYPNTWFQ